MTLCPLPKWGGKLEGEWTDECLVCSLTILVPHATSTGVSLFKKTLSLDQWILWARHACLCLVYTVNYPWASCLNHWTSCFCNWSHFNLKTPFLGYSTCYLKKRRAYDLSENVTLALTKAKISVLWFVDKTHIQVFLKVGGTSVALICSTVSELQTNTLDNISPCF